MTLIRFFGDNYQEVPEENIKFVDGNEGVFATYQNESLIHFLGGDDGAWWEMAQYHVDWCDAIAKNIYGYCSKGRRK